MFSEPPQSPAATHVQTGTGSSPLGAWKFEMELPPSVLQTQDFPGGPVVKESDHQCRRHELDPWSGNIPHAVGQLSPCTTREAPAMRSLSTATKSNPNSQQLEKSPCSTEDPQINTFIHKKRHVNQIQKNTDFNKPNVYLFLATFEHRWGIR